MKIISDEFKTELYGPLSVSTQPIIYKCAKFMSVSVGSVYARKNLNEEDSYLFYMDRSAGVIVKFNDSYVDMDTVYELNKSELEEVLDLVGGAVAIKHQAAYDNFIKLYKEMYECVVGKETKLEKDNSVFDGDLIYLYRGDSEFVSRDEFDEFYSPSSISFGSELTFNINQGWIEGSVETLYFSNTLPTAVSNPIVRCTFALFDYEGSEGFVDEFLLKTFDDVGINEILGIEQFKPNYLYRIDYYDLNKIMHKVKDLLTQYYPFKNNTEYQDSMNRLISLFDYTAEWKN